MAYDYRYLEVAKETTFGTAETAGTGTYTDIAKEDMHTEHTWADKPGAGMMIVAGKTITRTKTLGTIDYEIGPEDMTGHLLYSLLGGYNVSGVEAPYTHTFTEDQSTSRSLTLRAGREDKEFVFPGCFADQLALNLKQNALCLAQWTMTGKSEDSPASKQTPSFSSKSAFLMDNLTFTIGGTDKKPYMSAVSLTIDNQRKLDDAYGATPTMQRIPPVTRRKITGKMTFWDDEDADLYTKHLNGTTIEDTIIQLSNGTETLKFTIYEAKITSLSAGGGGRDPDQVDIDFEAQYDTGDSKGIEVELVNSVTTYA